MEAYKGILEKTAGNELGYAILWITVLCVIIGVVWLGGCLYSKQMKKKDPKKYNSKKQEKIRRQSILASAALTVICIAFGAILYSDAANTVSEINKDIEENTYITYTGGYYVSDSTHFMKHSIFNRRLSVNFDDGGSAFLYMNRISERVSSEEGNFQGKVVYGKNSLIVVDIEK